MLPKVIFSSLQANLYSLHRLLKGQTLRRPWRCSQVRQATLRPIYSEIRRGTCLMQLQLQWRRNSPVSATVNGSWPHLTRSTLHCNCMHITTHENTQHLCNSNCTDGICTGLCLGSFSNWSFLLSTLILCFLFSFYTLHFVLFTLHFAPCATKDTWPGFQELHFANFGTFWLRRRPYLLAYLVGSGGQILPTLLLQQLGNLAEILCSGQFSNSSACCPPLGAIHNDGLNTSP